MARSLLRFGLIVSAVAAMLATFAVTGVPNGTKPAGASDADMPIIGYTVFDHTAPYGILCQLVEVDWSTGETTVLPAESSSLTCVNDLAVAPDGTVHGFDPIFPDILIPSIYSEPTAETPIGRFVTFAADGTPSSIDVTLPQTYGMYNEVLSQFWGIAIAEDGTIFVTINRLWAHVATCEPGLMVGSLGFEPSDGDVDWTSCLFTLDPLSGALTLIGPSTMPGSDLAGLSIGSEGARTLHLQLSPESLIPSVSTELFWASVNLQTGSVLSSGNSYSVTDGLYDQLRFLPDIFTLLRDDISGNFFSGVVDPESGTITQIAPLMIGSEPVKSNDLRPALGISGGLKPAPIPEPVVPTFTG